MRRNEPEKCARALDDYDGRSRTPPVIRWKRAAPMRFRATARVREKAMTKRDDGRVRCIWGDSLCNTSRSRRVKRKHTLRRSVPSVTSTSLCTHSDTYRARPARLSDYQRLSATSPAAAAPAATAPAAPAAPAGALQGKECREKRRRRASVRRVGKKGVPRVRESSTSRKKRCAAAAVAAVAQS